ncbi:MAG: glycosyltransferase [Candidatus Woesebacteria bacterium]|nr:glycosyltransferase [Candidatus Woesebacteria bacterium]
MKILFISVYYPAFLESFYRKYGTKIKRLGFQKHRQKLLDELFGDADFYSDGVRANEYKAEDIVANDAILQKKWARERGLKIFDKTDFILKIPYLRFFFNPDWETKILEEQIRRYSPDILYFLDIEHFTPKFIRRIKKGRFVVAQKASPVFRMESFKEADLVFTSFPHFVQKFRSEGIKSEYLKLAFGERVLKIISKQKKIYNCTFAGGITRHHAKGNKILNEAANEEKLDVFGYGRDNLDKNSKLYKSHHGEVWGRDMYKVLMQSKMTINRHINIARGYANNMRLFEATGSGTLVLTDYKKNISDFFEEDKEIITYKNSRDLIKKIRYYTKHPKEGERIAKAGQQRTLKDHTYKVRMKEMLDLVLKYYGKSK